VEIPRVKPAEPWHPSHEQQRAARRLRTRIETTIGYGNELARWRWEDLAELLDPAEQRLLELIRDLDPEQYGVRVASRAISPIPTDLRLLGNQTYYAADGLGAGVDAYLPASTYPAFLALNRAIVGDLGRPLVVRWGYRSPACQATLYVWLLVVLDFDVTRAARSVLPPAYSPHCWPDHGSVDFVPSFSRSLPPPLDDFAQTAEYDWLCERAGEFGFVETWPQGNPAGLEHEPWDWRFIG
jgi:hypothetical protein